MTAASTRPVPEKVVEAARRHLAGETLDVYAWFALAVVADLPSLPTRESVVAEVLRKAEENGVVYVR